jgi:hypothetical protein
MTDLQNPTRIYFGKIDAMIAEVGAFDMGEAWFKECGYKYAVLAHDEAGTNFGTEYHSTKADAKAFAKEWADAIGGKIAAVY